MKLTAPVGFFKRAFGKDVPEVISENYRYHNVDAWMDVDTGELSEPELAVILAAAKKHPDDKALTKIAAKLETLALLKQNPDKAKVGRLENLDAALVEYLKRAEHKMIFVEEDDGFLVPYYVSQIKYHAADKRTQTPAYVRLTAKAQRHGDKEEFSQTWHHGDVGGGRTVSEVLLEAGVHRETPEMYLRYLEEVKALHAIYPQTGKQFAATGYAVTAGRKKYGGLTAMDRDGQPVRVVIDDRGDDEDAACNHKPRNEGVVSTEFWAQSTGDDEGDSIAVPVHPYVQVFDLLRHDHVLIHVNNLKPYAYDPTLGDKLVLPTEIKELIGVLVDSAAEVMEDIILGKTGGVVVIATGAPGTGKTLTAEVYSEHIERPLYSVQCSQLGTDEEVLEKRLNLVLDRASRWGAILLIDEADVYVRERGDDINQNAIVGVFLRLLERYRGVLFMTSNMETVFDDAIMSRAIAHVKYQMPSPEMLKRIWQILAENYKVALSNADLSVLLRDFPNISGRTVKNMLKLANIMCRKQKRPVDVAALAFVSKFIEMPKRCQ